MDLNWINEFRWDFDGFRDFMEFHLQEYGDIHSGNLTQLCLIVFYIIKHGQGVELGETNGVYGNYTVWYFNIRSYETWTIQFEYLLKMMFPIVILSYQRVIVVTSQNIHEIY